VSAAERVALIQQKPGVRDIEKDAIPDARQLDASACHTTNCLGDSNRSLPEIRDMPNTRDGYAH